ncbi:MAG TPA: hypothetical protein PKW52_08945 [Nitrospira sp.]|nr:hypothetical protein [Nitrospira sp.]MCE7977477.1 hypothetical protein [Nitrospira sp. NTP1]HQR15554.1 hypothetical protein [Nitrospira sp.]HQV11454.1 hypothetical protein [Nitrospira sp.]
MNHLILLVVLSLSVLAQAANPAASMAGTETEQAQEAISFSTVGFQSGVIDEVQGSTIRIDGRSYVLKANVLVIDHRSRPMEVERIVPTSLIKFHLKEGHIDKMMVTLPQ